MIKDHLLTEILKKYWGHNSFRPLQLQIIKSVLAKKDTLAILPTSGGKSVCYQLPALITEGVCIVISPLIALINDQVNQLKQKGIYTETIPSGSHTKDIVRIFDNIKIKKTKLLYLSPERLTQTLIQQKLAEINISFFAIDEAHCISEWGHDFRPSYLKTAILKTQYPKTNIIALTATATAKTKKQIIDILQLKNINQYIGSFYRPNLAYQIFETPNKFDLLLKILQKQNQPTIIYLQNKLAVQQLSETLNANQLKSTYYHAGLNTKQKEQSFKYWNTETHPIMIATNAFGMGIDKRNVKLVIHLEIPSSLENYTQEAGRGGRNGQKAFSCVIINNHDKEKFEKQTSKIINYKTTLNTYLNLNQHLKIAYGTLTDDVFSLDLEHFCLKYKTNITDTLKSIYQLQNYHILTLQKSKQKEATLKITTTPKNLLNYIKKNPKNSKTLNYILRNYPGLFEIEKQINISTIAKDLNTNPLIINSTLNTLQKLELLIFNPSDGNYSIQFLKPREDARTIAPFKKQLQQLEYIGIEKHKKSIAFFNNTKVCRNQLILEYFNQKHLNDCGICDICLANKNNFTAKEVRNTILEILHNQPCTFNELIIKTKLNTESLKKGLNYFLNENKIKQQQHIYSINE